MPFRHSFPLFSSITSPELPLTCGSIEQELSRLNRNKERRFAREKQKGVLRPSGDSPADGAPGSSKSAGTQRKCANCGQVGHIKTNKKCVLNRSVNADDGFPTSFDISNSFFSSSTPSLPKRSVSFAL
jgi:transcription initiation factor TFIID subunit 1